MRINGVDFKNVVELYAKAVPSAARNDKSKTDEVVLTESGQEILKLRKKLAEIPEVREELVSKIKEKILSGEYQIDVEKLAAKLKEWGEF
ncbi:flagellar biosynthesis anti-sigma factor FlgM [Carboxydothermus ferrireducens]|uniref:Negative regulator of flagellin synthesis n=1 Tax=Carboxydothermus ferrireducens DSM 11255 TaxID=1119529 RepID=A0ABX2R7G8_9THEO|nr:flagellar biosynthesis anti-sigma factor FlgM [Carboxydothermus ferrireducens]NYE56874.1 negative regulator of flagellin synthesis FlgM [Carboxydothermus ferrireducens DSM 11255]